MNRGNGGYIGILKEGLTTYPFSGVYPLYEQHENKLYGSWLDKSDPNFANTTLLLKTNASLARSTTAVDSSSNFTVTRVGTPSLGWTGPYQADGHWSGYFNGSSQLSIPNNAAFEIGAGDFSYEAFVYATQAPNTYAQGIISYGIAGNTGASTCDMQISAAGFFSLAYATGAALTLSDPTSFPTNQWVHCVACRTGSTISLFVNGVRKAAATTSATVGTGGAMVIGCQWYANESARQLQNGYISNVRVLKGASAYDATLSTLTVPTAPLAVITNTSLLTCQSNRFIDKGTANGGLSFTITPSGTPQATPYYPSTFTAPTASPGAVLLNGTTDYFTAPNTSNGLLDLSQRTVSTVECWVYPTSRNSSQATIAGTRMGAGGGWEFRINTNGTVSFYKTATGASVTSSATAPLYQWTFVATTQNGTALTLTVNSVSVSNTTGGAGSFSSTTCGFGGDSLAVDAFPGYIANLRISTVVRTIAVPTTPLTTDANTSLLLNFAESTYASTPNGATNNTFVDTGPYAVTITRNGTPTQGSLTPYWPNGQWSNYLNNNAAYLTFPLITLGSTFTIEGWFYTTSIVASSNVIISNRAQDSGTKWLGFINSDRLAFSYAGTNREFLTTINVNTWYHFAFVVTSSTVAAYLNGTKIGATQAAPTSFTLDTISGYGTAGMTGYLSNLRIVNGVAVYTGAFIPPTSPLQKTQSSGTNISAISGSETSLLTCQSNRFIDNSNGAIAITPNGTPRVQAFQPLSTTAYTPAVYGGSGYFNGSTDFLTSSSSTFLSWIGTNSGFVECWIYLTAASQTCEIVGKSGISGSSNPNWSFGISSGRLRLLIGSSGSPGTLSVTLTAATTLPLFTWINVAAARNYVGGASVNVYTIYLNGVIDGGTTGPNPGDGSPNALYVGREPAAPRWMTGYISNLRFFNATIPLGYQTGSVLTTINSGSVPANGTVVYTPSTTPLTAITGASFLLDFTNAAIYDATMQNSLTTVGSAQGNTAAYKWWNSSVLFNGSTDYLTAVPNTAGILNFGTNPYTIEFWFYGLSKTTNQVLLRAQNATGSLEIFINTAGIITLGTQATSTYVTIPSVNWTLSTWTHIAFVRAGTGANQLTAYVNGTAVATGTDAFNYTINGIDIGAGTNYSGGYYLNGYMQDLRITKNVARYVVMSVPVVPLTTVIGSSLLLKTNSAANGQQNNTFLDSGTANGGVGFTVTRNGAATQGSFTPYWPNGQWSNYFDGSSSLNLATNAIPASGAFTFETFVYVTGTASYQAITTQYPNGTAAGRFQIFRDNTTNKFAVSLGASDILTSDATYVSNTWVYLVVQRDASNVWSLYVNGMRNSATVTNATAIDTAVTYIGNRNVGGLPHTGYISNLRIVSSALYSGSTISVPTKPFSVNTTNQVLLTCYSNRFIDANTATTAKAITVNSTPQIQAFQPFSPAAEYTPALYGGSGYFPPSSSSYLSSTITALSNTFVVMECWVYNNSLDNSQGNHYLQMGAASYVLSHGGNGLARFLSRNDSSGDIFDINSASGVLKLNQWQYIVGIRNATTASLYVDGTRVSTLSVSTSSTSATTFYASSNAGTGRYLDGYMANARIISGSLPSGYNPTSTTIAVPTTPLTAVANTCVLLNFTNAAIYDAAAQNNVTTVGDSQASTTQSKWLPSSMFFDGTGDYLTMPIPSGASTTITSGNFTIDFWLNPSTVAPASQAIVGTRESDGSTSINWGIFLQSNQISFQAYSTSNTLIGTITHQTALLAGTWYYCALTRNGSIFTLYVNSVASTSTATSSATIQQAGGTTLYVGKFAAASTIGALNGYIQDLRITRGTYAINFTAPAAPFLTS
jgi:hypothetical protein